MKVAGFVARDPEDPTAKALRLVARNRRSRCDVDERGLDDVVHIRVRNTTADEAAQRLVKRGIGEQLGQGSRLHGING
jgi:hypothetical protein